jgi:hypothetical protein
MVTDDEKKQHDIDNGNGRTCENDELKKLVKTEDETDSYSLYTSSSNNSLSSLSPSSSSSFLVQVLGLSEKDSQTLMNAFDTDTSSSTASEIRVGDRILNVEVSPLLLPSNDLLELTVPKAPMNQRINTSRRYVVVFRDVTSERAREQAELAAERKALHVQAMTESIEVVYVKHPVLPTILKHVTGFISLTLLSSFGSLIIPFLSHTIVLTNCGRPCNAPWESPVCCCRMQVSPKSWWSHYLLSWHRLAYY